jgi:sugar O-acyltransferase (sialic acid O-acetyltransferase NeuD family)
MILFIYGAGGAGIDVHDLAKKANENVQKYTKIILIDDYQEETEYHGTQRIHFDSCKNFAKGEEFEFVIAVGEPSARRLLAERLKDYGYTLATLVDDTALVRDAAILSPGCIISAGAIISSNVRLEENCYVQGQAIVGHGAYVKRDTVICPKATVGGNAIVGEQCFLGLHSSVLQGIKIGDQAIVAMGSMVFRDVENGATVAGNPARVTKGNSEHKVFI